MEQLKILYSQHFGRPCSQCEALPASGSNRQYFRLYDKGGSTVIGVVGTSQEENQAFCYLSGHFALRRLPVPEVLCVSDDGMRYLQTDLGTQ